MRPKLYEAIDMAVAAGVPTNMLADVLVGVGWPRDLINQGVEEWLVRNASRTTQTDFKTWLKKYQHRAMPAVFVVVVIGLIQAVFMLLRPWPTKIIADSALGAHTAPGPLAPFTHTPELLGIAAVMTIVIFIASSAFSWISDLLLLRIGFWLNRSIKAESFRHILHLPLFHQERLAKGDYVYRQNVVTSSLSELVLGTTASIIGSVILIIGVVAIMLHFNVVLTMISLVLMPLLYLTTRLITPRMGFYARRLNKVNSATASRITEAVNNAETVQAFTLEEKLMLRVDDLWLSGYNATRSTLVWNNLLKYTNSMLVVLATATVMFFGGLQALHQKMTFGELFIFMTYMGYLLRPIENLVQKVTSRFQKKIDVSRVYEVLSDHEGIENLRNDRLLPTNLQGVVDLQNVSYAYNGVQVFQNLSLHIDKGEKVGIIGPSGSGKSTLLKLLPLFIEPDTGTILLDGVDTQSVSLQGLRRSIAWVSQTPQLFTGSILENIFDGDVYRQVALNEVKHAVEVANVLEFTAKLPMGINSPAGEDGSALSGGQRQRVAIARSLIKLQQAVVLCLDEPTAALDAKSENYIRDSLQHMIQGKTVLMVTHRRPLLALMDTIYVLDNGKLTNVNELGGLEAYLAMLDGITQQRIEKSIEEDRWYARAEQVDDLIDIHSSQVPYARETKPEHAYGGNKSNNKVYTMQQNQADQATGTSDDDRTPLIETDENDEVVINLH